MATVDSLLKHVGKMQERLQPPETRLPYLVIDCVTGEDLPGYEAHNCEHEEIAHRLRCLSKIYGFDPNDDGSELG